MAYQENELVRQCVEDGHTVEVIASTEIILPSGELGYTNPGRYVGTDCAIVERLPYLKAVPRGIGRKLRMHPGLYRKIALFAPDIILFHGAAGWELNTAARYVRENPTVVLYVDSHEDATNSARSLISKWLLHHFYYRRILLNNLDAVRKVLAVSVSCETFLKERYSVPPDMIEFFPLGGRVPSDSHYYEARIMCRAKFGIGDDDVLVVQSGKIDRSKKLVEALESFKLVDDTKLRFLVAGTINEDIFDRVSELANADERIILAGWQTSEDLRNILCAGDVYCQPGTQSSTMQMAVSCRCAVILDDIPSHVPYIKSNGWLVGKSLGLYSVFRLISERTAALRSLQYASYELACNMLDYRILAQRLYIRD